VPEALLSAAGSLDRGSDNENDQKHNSGARGAERVCVDHSAVTIVAIASNQRLARVLTFHGKVTRTRPFLCMRIILLCLPSHVWFNRCICNSLTDEPGLG
jgi:hypothetical protein